MKNKSQYPLGFEGVKVPEPLPSMPMPLPSKSIPVPPSVPVGSIMVPMEKMKAMQDYAKELHKKYPKMKQARVMRKVCARFHIKLVTK